MKDTVIEFIVSEAKKVPTFQRVVLFGSRARGDATDRSDYDIAVSAPELDAKS